MADTKQVEAPTNAPDFPESSMNQFDDDGHYIDGPGYPSRELSAEEVVARKLYEERQRAAAEGRESLTEQEQVHRRLHPIERFSVASNVSMELIVNHNTKEATLRLTGGGNRSGRRSELGGLTINLPAGSWSFEPESRVKL